MRRYQRLRSLHRYTDLIALVKMTTNMHFSLAKCNSQ